MSETRSLLLEIHCEEIPARFLAPLAAEFQEGIQAFMAENLQARPQCRSFYSPRKLAWRIQGLPVAQADQSETQVGPPGACAWTARASPPRPG